jgi:hypothetical protein
MIGIVIISRKAFAELRAQLAQQHTEHMANLAQLTQATADNAAANAALVPVVQAVVDKLGSTPGGVAEADLEPVLAGLTASAASINDATSRLKTAAGLP